MMCSSIEVLALVLVDALDLHVEQRRRVDQRRRCGLDVVGEMPLVGALDGPATRAGSRSSA
jgi:hypothetical protein